MQAYAVFLCLVSLFIVFWNARLGLTRLMSCHSMVMLAPVWFLYLEAVFPGGDCWLLPANQVILALSSGVFFLMIFNLLYCVRPPASVISFHEKNFLKSVNPSFLPTVGIILTLVTFLVILARYGWDWEETKRVYLAGRAAGSGLIKRGGVGGWEVFLQPLQFMSASVPTIAALSWVRFGSEHRAGVGVRIGVTVCALLLIFVMFLGGSRGNMAVYLAGPASIWILFGGNAVGRLPHIAISLLMFIGLIGIWEYQKQKRANLLKGVSSFSDIAEQTTFDVRQTHRDNNLYLLTLHHMYMPSLFPFKGYYEFYLFLVNPIPRAIWPNKPKGIQESRRAFQFATGPAAMGPIKVGTASLSYSIVGDGYRMHHYFGIALYAALFGFLASFWDYIGQKRMLSSRLYFILNAAWLFWMLWGFRAAFAFFTGMYPVWGAYLLCWVASKFSAPAVPGPSASRYSARVAVPPLRHEGRFNPPS